MKRSFIELDVTGQANAPLERISLPFERSTAI